MARIHTDFLALPIEVYDILLDVLSESDGVLTYKDVLLRDQQSLERGLSKFGFKVIKREYIK